MKEYMTKEKQLFDMIYQWGRVGIVTDEKSEAFQSLLDEIKREAINDNRRHGDI